MLSFGNSKKNHARRKGVLTLEWILLVTVMVIGILGGLALVRNAVVAELQDLANAVIAINGGS